MEALRTAARLLLAWLFVSAGQDVLRRPDPRAAAAGPLLDRLLALAPGLPIDRIGLVRANAAAQLVAGGLLALGQRPRLAALVLAGSMVPTTLGGHAFWRETEPGRRAQQRLHFNKNLAVVGGLLLAILDRGEHPRAGRQRRRR